MAQEHLFDETVHKANVWLDEINQQTGATDRHRAWRALGAVLHALRDRLPFPEAVKLGAQLPLLIRALYFSEWDVSRTPTRTRHIGEFLAPLSKAFPNEPTQMTLLANAVLTVLAKHVSKGEIEHVAHVLPAELRELFPSGELTA